VYNILLAIISYINERDYGLKIRGIGASKYGFGKKTKIKKYNFFCLKN